MFTIQETSVWKDNYIKTWKNIPVGSIFYFLDPDNHQRVYALMLGSGVVLLRGPFFTYYIDEEYITNGEESKISGLNNTTPVFEVESEIIIKGRKE